MRCRYSLQTMQAAAFLKTAGTIIGFHRSDHRFSAKDRRDGTIIGWRISWRLKSLFSLVVYR